MKKLYTLNGVSKKEKTPMTIHIIASSEGEAVKEAETFSTDVVFSGGVSDLNKDWG